MAGSSSEPTSAPFCGPIQGIRTDREDKDRRIPPRTTSIQPPQSVGRAGVEVRICGSLRLGHSQYCVQGAETSLVVLDT